MLDGSYLLSTAMSFVGYSPNTGFVRTDPPPLQFDLALIPDVPVGRPTTTVSPRPELGLMPVNASLKSNKKTRTGSNPEQKRAEKTAAGINAIRFFISDWLDAAGETITRLDELLSAYNDLRSRHPELPECSKIKFSKLLAAAGCRRMTESLPRDGKDERGRRFVVFEMRAPRKSSHRRAA